MKKETKYVHFPVNMIPSIISDTDKTIETAICYGVIRYSEKLEVELEEACRQLMYCFYRQKDTIPLWLIDKVLDRINVGSLSIDEGYSQFTDTSFEPASELEDLKKILDEDEGFKESIIQFHRVRQSLWFFDLSSRFSIQYVINTGMKIKNNLQSKEPIVSANLDVLLSFCKNENKNENDKIHFIGFLAIKSIIGEKEFVKTNKKLILARMMGFKTYLDIEPDKLNEPQSYIFERFSHRYHMDNLITMLELDWHLITYSNKVRGIYLAIDKISLDDLALYVEKQKKKARLIELKKMKNEAKNKAIKRLKSNEDNDYTTSEDENSTLF